MMLGPYNSENEMLKCILYWQKRALAAERELDSEFEYEQFLLDEYIKMQEAYFDLERKFVKKVMKDEWESLGL